jgi:hypothetical protein
MLLINIIPNLFFLLQKFARGNKMSVLPLRTELFGPAYDLMNQQAAQPAQPVDSLFENEELQEENGSTLGSGIDPIAMTALLPESQIPKISNIALADTAVAQKNERLNPESTEPSKLDHVSDGQNEIIAQIEKPDLQKEALKVSNNSQPKFSLLRVCQRISNKLFSLFSFRRGTNHQNKEETKEVNEVEIVKVQERKVEHSSENLAKILDKLPKSLLDKFNQFQEENKIKVAFSKATKRYEAVINSSARKYSKLTLEEKTDLALQEGARVISNALNALK